MRLIIVVPVSTSIHTKTSGKCSTNNSIGKYNSIGKKMIYINTLSSNIDIDTNSCTKYKNSNMDEMVEAVEKEEKGAKAVDIQDNNICI